MKKLSNFEPIVQKKIEEEHKDKIARKKADNYYKKLKGGKVNEMVAKSTTTHDASYEDFQSLGVNNASDFGDVHKDVIEYNVRKFDMGEYIGYDINAYGIWLMGTNSVVQLDFELAVVGVRETFK